MATETPAVDRSQSTLAEKETDPESSIEKTGSSASPGLQVKSLHRRNDQVLIRQSSQDMLSTMTCPRRSFSTSTVAANCLRQSTQELTALHNLPLGLGICNTIKITKQLSFENTRRKRFWSYVPLYWLFFLLRQ